MKRKLIKWGKKVGGLFDKLIHKLNLLYIAIVTVITKGVGLLMASYWITD